MKVIIQRVKEASVEVDSKITGEIDYGLLVYVGFNQDDSDVEIEKMALKLKGLRIFDDKDGKINLSLVDVSNKILLVSQFTLYGDIKKGNRPSFTKSLNFDDAKKLYDKFISELKKFDIIVAKGIFGADMKVKSTNDGPINFIYEI